MIQYANGQLLVPPLACTLTLEERGLLATMMNIPEADYCTAKELAPLAGSTEPKVLRTLQSLAKQNYVVIDNGVYIVNKIRMHEMMLIGGDTNAEN